MLTKLRLSNTTSLGISSTRNRMSWRRYGSRVIQRNDYKSVNDDDLSVFKRILGEKNVITDSFSLENYNKCWMGKYEGHSRVALLPQDTQQVSQILAYCNEQRIAVCPQGGNTGLVGGSVPVFDEVVLSLKKMNNILKFHEDSGIVVTEAGVILENLESYVNEKGHIIPLDLGAKGSCLIGGIASTNAGGIRLLRYGSLHGSILGLEVVLADGKILKNLSTLRKDNTGYDLKQLFIGSEGTLGVITGLSILCPPQPKAINVAIMGINSFEDGRKALKKAKLYLSEVLSSFEFLDSKCMDYVTSHYDNLPQPLEEKHPFYLVLETAGSNAEHDLEKLNQYLEHVSEEGLIQDGTVGQDKTQNNTIWKYREFVPEAVAKMGRVYVYDISLPLDHMYEIVRVIADRMKQFPEVEVSGYGHMGDGNLHLNILAPEYADKYRDLIEPFVYEYVSNVNGSISAEHGIGQMKPEEILFSKSREEVDIMHVIKKSLDPNGILNPYKVLPALEKMD
eukprot:TRINITY_DN1720_c0_g1_i2.p1 TRINITY_DN1720_c0_g1~~TRINITY_DN1720_c0_g1_i2.p1  ORF type:complete len:507 (-),score=130.45 TRINITY_DN1720_c0_g1_i2:899-2419(-)